MRGVRRLVRDIVGSVVQRVAAIGRQRPHEGGGAPPEVAEDARPVPERLWAYSSTARLE